MERFLLNHRNVRFIRLFDESLQDEKEMNMLLVRIIFFVTFIVCTGGWANASLTDYRENLRISAASDFERFRASVGIHFGASGLELDHIFLAVDHPSDAVLCFWLADNSGHSLDRVLDAYRAHKSQGWGSLAQSLGIRPGSEMFKALKSGHLGWNPPGVAQTSSPQGKHRGKSAKHKKK